MIDWIKSAEINNCTVEWLKTRFERFPSSHKKVWRVCNNCCNEREVTFDAYTDLCHSCSMKQDKVREAARLKTIEQFSNSAARKAARLKAIEQWSNPENRELAAKIANERWSVQENRDMMSKIIMNSDIYKKAMKNQRGGFDIVCHHVAYDFNDLATLRVKVTRKFHSLIHHPKGCQFHQRCYSLID